MNKLGMHIHGIKPGVVEAVALLQPRTVTIMDPTAEDVRAVRNVADPFVVARKYEDGRDWQATDPYDWAEQCYAMTGGERVDGFVAWNEPFGHDHASLFQPFDEWTYAFLAACREMGPTEAVVLCFGTGNFTAAPDRVRVDEAFPLTCAHAQYFGPHDYSWPTLSTGAGWYALRWKQWIHDMGRYDMKFVVTEAGLTQAVIAGRGDVGWRSGGPEGVTEDSYIATLDWYNVELCKVPQCLGCCLYDYAGNWYGWDTFEQLGLEHRIYQIDAPGPEPEPPGNGGEPMDIRVFNIDGIELFGEEAADLVRYHGIMMHQPTNMRRGEYYWALTKLEEREGPACVIYTGLKEDGSPAAGQEAAWAWADDMGEADDILGDSYPTDWQKEADVGFLNENGNMGPAFGQSGWYHDPYEPGPGRAWIRDPLRWSVFLTGIGMLGMTNHRTMYPTWQIRQWTEEEEPPMNGEILTLVRKINIKTDRILELMEDGYVPPEPPQPPEPPPPEPPPEPPPPAKEVFHVQFYNSVDLSGPVVYEMDEPLHQGKPFFWHAWEGGSPHPSVNVDNFSGRWEGTFTFEAGTYRFNVLTDDGVRLWVDDRLLIDQWHDQAPYLYSENMSLSAGKHKARIEWYERGGGATLHFTWQKI